MTEHDDWYFGEGEPGFGPFSLEQLRQLLAVGLLSSSDLVWTTGARRIKLASALERSADPSANGFRRLPLAATGATVALLVIVAVAWSPAKDRLSGEESSAKESLAQAGPKAAEETTEVSLPLAHEAAVPVSDDAPSQPESVAAEVTVAGTPVADVPKAERGRPAQPPAIQEILPLIDLKRDVVQGRWNRDGETLRCDEGGGTLALPVEIPEHFELVVRVTRLSGRTAFSIGIVRHDITGLVILDNWEGSGLEEIDGKRRRENGTYIHRKHFEIGRENEVIVRVDGESVVCLIGGEPVINWQGDYRRLSLSGNQRALGAPFGKLCLYSDSRSVHRISGLTLRSLTKE